MAEDRSSAKGVRLLLVSLSGTGKTLAARALAAALGRELHTVDLARLVSKYIGETEKHVDEVFRKAERTHSVLFFDEADALFGRRTEVSDAHDRYANLDTAYLLKRIESFEGVVILATRTRPVDPPDWVKVIVEEGDDDPEERSV